MYSYIASIIIMIKNSKNGIFYYIVQFCKNKLIYSNIEKPDAVAMCYSTSVMIQQ